jgi:hypothetical protein
MQAGDALIGLKHLLSGKKSNDKLKHPLIVTLVAVDIHITTNHGRPHQCRQEMHSAARM